MHTRIALFFGISVVTLGCGGDRYAFQPPVTSSAVHADANGSAGPAKPPGEKPEPAADQIGLATWYGDAFAGRKTANGERFDPKQLTAAHRTLPFGTWVEVRRIDTGRMVRVRINDRGPFGHADRVIDLSKKAAGDLDIVREGVAKVEIRVVDGP